jgi:class 3 adenylate cyclase
MAFRDDLRALVDIKFKSQWTTREGRVVPDEASLKLGNDGINIDATVLYADLSDSTKLVDQMSATFAAEVYGTFLACASRIIRANGGAITAFDGDRVMAVYMGETKELDACVTALRINKAMSEVVRPSLLEHYPANRYVPQHTVGVDSSKLLVIKDGIRGANDLVWVGRAANYAAKMCALNHSHSTYITADVFGMLPANLLTTNIGTTVWEPVRWVPMNNMLIYRTTCVTAGWNT